MKKRIRQNLNFLGFLFLKIFSAKPDAVISFGISPGDDLLCSIVAQQLKQKGYKRIWMLTCFPEIFFNNPHINKVIKQDESGNISLPMRKYFKSIETTFIHPWYTHYNKITDRDEIPLKHIVHLMCDKANVEYPEIIKPNFYLTDIEKRKGKLFYNQVCIHSTGVGAKQHMQNKDWYPERFEEVVLSLKNKYTVIQIGTANDHLLSGVIDMRGKTTVREAAAILYNSKFFIGQVGFLMHLARAVDCKAVIIYGGRERPDQSGYDYNINLYSPVYCSPCWYWNYCPNDKICMQHISGKDVISAVEKLTPIENNVCVEFDKMEYNGAC
jgi:hypothetical protein